MLLRTDVSWNKCCLDQMSLIMNGQIGQMSFEKMSLSPNVIEQMSLRTNVTEQMSRRNKFHLSH